MNTRLSLALLAVIAFPVAVAVAQSSNSLQVTSSGFSSGGETGSGGGYTVTHILGEPIAGISSGSNYFLVAGFLTPDAIEQGPDLKLTFNPSAVVVTENITRSFTLSVSNSGTIPANDVRLVINLPPGLRAAAATNSAGPCQITASNVTCSVAILSSSGLFDVRLTVVASPLSESANEFESLNDLTALVSASEIDLNPEDNALALPVTVWLRLDWGDARGGFPVTRAENGARHRYWPGYRIGALWDSEGTGVHSPLANWDDGQQASDEDGVVFPTPIVAGEPATVTVNSSFTGFLDAWADLNNDGDWADAGEQIFANQRLEAGDNTLNFMVPATAVASNLTTRWRASTTGGLSYAGYGGKGEVEDHLMPVQAARRPTLQLANGISTITFPTETQVNYIIEYSDSLTMPIWHLLTRTTGSGNVAIATDSANNPSRFYRIRVE